jgi:hypothetical protein
VTTFEVKRDQQNGHVAARQGVAASCGSLSEPSKQVGIMGSHSRKYNKEETDLKRLLTCGIAVGLVGIMASPMAALAAPATGNVNVTGTLAEISYNLILPASPLSLTLARGQEASATLTGISASTDGASTQVTIAVKDGSTQGGKMKSGSDFLASEMQIAGGTLSKTNLLDTDLTLVANQNLTSGSYTLSPAAVVSQRVAAGDAAGSYSITLTFTATFN